MRLRLSNCPCTSVAKPSDRRGRRQTRAAARDDQRSDGSTDRSVWDVGTHRLQNNVRGGERATGICGAPQIKVQTVSTKIVADTASINLLRGWEGYAVS